MRVYPRNMSVALMEDGVLVGVDEDSRRFCARKECNYLARQLRAGLMAPEDATAHMQDYCKGSPETCPLNCPCDGGRWGD